ncbi:unnamed protein product [Lactuca saligna]|uniref:Uncharacterized protein n=1 Tax=Lactuca saligna TaxID=75948 RepID=A0AA35Z2I8_LACSI|nr:unnamed protein product [Lactuca saligna]
MVRLAKKTQKAKGSGALPKQWGEDKKEPQEKEKPDEHKLEQKSKANDQKAQEVEAKIAKITLETHNSLFRPWLIKRIQREAIDDLSVYWLEPMVSFDLNKEAYYQFDFPIIPRAFMFMCFEKIEKALTYVSELFYLKYTKPQYQTWRLKRIMGLKVSQTY